MTFMEFIKSGILLFTATMISAVALFGFSGLFGTSVFFDKGKAPALQSLQLRAPARVLIGGQPVQVLNKPFTYDGRTWKTFWHRLSAEPYADNKECLIKVTIVSDIEHADTPEFALQRMNEAPSLKYVRRDWNEEKDSLVTKAVEEFFKQNQKELEQLKATGSAPIEAHIGDAYWGVGLDNTGANKLGKILEEVRKK